MNEFSENAGRPPSQESLVENGDEIHSGRSEGKEKHLAWKRAWAVLVVVTPMLGMLFLVLFQLKTTLGLVRETRYEKSRTMLTLLAEEVRQSARFGPFLLERLEDAFENLLQVSELRCIVLRNGEGETIVEKGECPSDLSGMAAQHGAKGKGGVFLEEAGQNALAGEIRFRISDGGESPPHSMEAGGTLPIPGAMPARDSGKPVRGDLLLQVVMDTSLDARIAGGALYPSLFLIVTLALLCAALFWLVRFQRRSMQAEHALSLSRQQNQHLHAVQMMAAGVAHEIKNPLGTIRGFAQLAQKSFSGRSKERHYMEVMLRELDRINERVARLLHFSRPRALHREAVDPVALVQHVLELLDPDMRAREISCRLRMDSEPPLVSLDEAQFQELVVNIVLNALEASSRGQEIELRCRRRTEGPPCLRLEVIDQGKGMDAHTKQMAFEPYFTTKERGSGLGLANCLKIVEAHGGTIHLKSILGKGTRVTVDIPVA